MRCGIAVDKNIEFYLFEGKTRCSCCETDWLGPNEGEETSMYREVPDLLFLLKGLI